MKKHFINKLEPGQDLKDEAFIVKNFKKAKTSNNKEYWSLILGDRTGEIDAKVWEDTLDQCETCKQGDVIIVTGDHSTPSIMKYHSWHPVPTILWSKYCRKDNVKEFGERACIGGGLGPRFPSTDLMPLALANSNRLEKFGA